MTGRLRLRPIDRSDAMQIEQLLAGDRDAIGMTERVPDPCTADAARDWIEHRQADNENVFAIELANSAEMIGVIGFCRTNNQAVLGYWVGRPYWNRGYATEAGTAALALMHDLGIRRVTADVFTNNARSARVLEKLGFVRREGIVKHIPARGGDRSLDRFSRTLEPRDDIEAMTPPG